jgi:hypothetical protein
MTMTPDPYSHSSTMDTSGTSAGDVTVVQSTGPVFGQGQPADDQQDDQQGENR